MPSVERSPHQASTSESRMGHPKDGPAWDIMTVLQTLKASAQTCEDPTFGAGYRLGLRDAPGGTEAYLELYPQEYAARYSAGPMRIEISQVSSVDARADRLRINAGDENQSSALLLKADGSLIFTVAPLAAGPALANEDATSGKMNGAEPVFEQQLQVDESQEVESDIALSESQRSESAVSQEGTKSKEGKRLVLSGRVGATPIFRSSAKNQTPIARFPLAVPDEKGKITWANIVTFGKRADKLKDSLAKGQAVQVVGYLHTREKRSREGKNKTVEEIFAVVVNPVKGQEKDK